MGKSIYLSNDQIKTLKYIFELIEYNNVLDERQTEDAKKIKEKIQTKINLDDFTLIVPGESAQSRWEKRIKKDAGN